MDNKPLILVNQYLLDTEKYHKALITSVATSTSIETGVPSETIARVLVEMEQSELMKKKKGSSQ